MIFTDENRTLTICQTTGHAMLVPWGRLSRYLRLSERLRAAVAPRCHQDATPGGDLILEFGLASLAGYEYLADLNLGPHPLAKDQAVQDAWDIQFRHYTTLSRYLYELDESDTDQVQNDTLVLSTALAITRSKSELVLENALLRQQLIVLNRPQAVG